MDKAADEIIDLMNGGSGPYFENETSFFGRKNTNPTMKDANMQTDCGGMIITKAELTYGEADKISNEVNLEAVIEYITDLRYNKFSSRYWDGEDRVYYGQMLWVIYSYLTSNKIIPGDPLSYNNSMEYLYKLILEKMVNAKLVIEDKKLIYSPLVWYTIC